LTTSTAGARAKDWKNVWRSWGWHALALVFFTYIFGISTNFSLNDPDVWWHLKTGQWIVENREIPSEDPFSYTTPHPLSDGQKHGLRANWLAQVIFYASYSMAGLLGVGFLRGLLIVLPMFAIYLWLVDRGARPWMALCAVSLSSFMLSVELFYAFERPQGISFFMTLLAIMLLEELKKGRRPALFLTPVLMALWSNMHGGFIVGNVIIALYIFGEAAVWAFRKLRGSAEKPSALFFGGAAAGLAASGLNPNGYSLSFNYLSGLASMFFRDVKGTITRQGGSGWVEEVVLEFKPLAYFYSELFYKWLIYYWLFLGLLFLVLIAKYIIRRKFDFTEFFTVAFISFFANYYARGLMFSLVVSAFYFGKSLLEMREYLAQKASALAVRLIPAVASLMMLALTSGLLVMLSGSHSWALRPNVTRDWLTPWYPLAAVEFLKAERIEPPMYNFYTWGGFLIWSLYPDYKVFIDGRALDDTVNKTADGILKAHPDWRIGLDAYNINFIVTPVIFRESGHIIPLARALAEDEEWKLVFVGINSAIFVRDVPKNADLVKRYNRDKKDVYWEIVNIENILLMGSPGNPTYNLSKAEALLALGLKDEARAVYETLPFAQEIIRQKFGEGN
jgi:hypothetical protein